MKGGDGVRMLYATDGSAGAAVALDLICALSLRPVDEVIVVSHPAFLILARPNEGVVGRAMERRRQRAREVVERDDERQGVARLREAAALIERLTVRTELERGPVAETVLARASAMGADLVVLGSRGASGPRRPFWGSTAERVLVSARCPVLVAPIPATADIAAKPRAEAVPA